MSEDKKGDGDPKVGEDGVVSDEAVKKIIEERVIKHIVEVRNQPAAPVSTPKIGEEGKVSQKPNEETPEELLKRLQESESAREEAEKALEERTKELGVSADELEQRKSQLDALALKEYEEKKSILVGKVRETQGDEKADEVEEMIKTGADVERVTRWLEIFSDALVKTVEPPDTSIAPETGEQKKAPAGKVSGRAPADPNADTRASGAQWVMEVYDNLEEQHFLRRMGMAYDARKLEEFEGKRNQLLRNFLKGEKTRQSITRMSVMECRSCSTILTKGETECPECGANIYHKVGGGP